MRILIIIMLAAAASALALEPPAAPAAGTALPPPAAVTAPVPTVTPFLGNDVIVVNKIRLALGDAEEEVAFATDRFTDYSVADTLTLLVRRGRRVRVVIGADPQDSERGRAIVTYLERAGVEVLVGDMGKPLYSRFMVIDKKAVIVGSYPFVDGAASSPFADVVRIDDAALAARYLAFFDYIWTAQR